MSKLSELLNPAPTSVQHSPPQLPQPLVLDGQDHRVGHRSSFDGHSTSPTLFASITSPGLDALAAAASSTAPMLSSPQNSTFAQSGSYQGYNHYGSRPGSSHTLPPPSSEFSHAGNQSSTHASGLDQYHHSSHGEGKLSNDTDYSARLPPLVQSPPTQNHSFPTHAPGATVQEDLIKYANGDTSEQIALTPSRDRDGTHKQDPYPNSDAPATSQIRQPSPGPSDSISASNLPKIQSDQVEIKAEVQENSLETQQQYKGPTIESSTISFDQPSNIGTPTLKSITDIKKDASHTPSPTPPDSATMKTKSAPSKKRAAPKKGAGTAKPPSKKRKIESESVDGTPPAQRTGTPATSRASLTPAPKNRKQGSETPARSSSTLNGEEDDEDATDDGELFCICRKPDDHTLMIACDGPCEGWFHGRCVDMAAEKTKLISKWYCEFPSIAIDWGMC